MVKPLKGIPWLNHFMDGQGYERVCIDEGPKGDVYVAERWHSLKARYEVVWALRRRLGGQEDVITRDLEMWANTSQKQRAQAAITDARDFEAIQNSVFIQ